MKILEAPEEHWAAAALRKQPIPSVARALNVSTNYLRCVLNGTHNPSKSLDERIEKLVNELSSDASERPAA